MEVQFCYADIFKNELIKFIWDIIDKIKEENQEFSEAIDIITNQEKNANKVVKKEERSERIKNAYSIVREVIRKNKDMTKNEIVKKFRKKFSKKNSIFLTDDTRDYLMDDVFRAFDDLFYGKGKNVEENDVGKGTMSLRHKPMYAIKKDGSVSTEKQGGAHIIFKDEKAYYRIWDLRHQSISKIFDLYNEKDNVFLTNKGGCPSHKWTEFEIGYNKASELQGQLFSNIYIGATKLSRYWKRGKYRYRVQINFDKVSPVVTNINNPKNHIVGVDWGTETVAIVRDDGYQEIIELSPNSPRVTDEIRQLDVYLNNSRRATNPDLFFEDGRIKYTKKEMKKNNLKWEQSNRYKKAAKKKKECYRILRENRKINNLTLVKHKIIMLGNAFHTEFNTFSAWGMKGVRMAEKTKEKYLTNNRRDYTKQIHDRAPRDGRCKIEIALSTKKSVLW